MPCPAMNAGLAKGAGFFDVEWISIPRVKVFPSPIIRLVEQIHDQLKAITQVIKIAHLVALERAMDGPVGVIHHLEQRFLNRLGRFDFDARLYIGFPPCPETLRSIADGGAKRMLSRLVSAPCKT